MAGIDKHDIRLLCYNIDGLDKNNKEERTNGVCEIIKQNNPHIVFLQEIVPSTEKILRHNCKNYELISGHMANSFNYYTVILLRKDSVSKLQKPEIIPFPTSRMGRNLLIVHAKIKGVKLTLINSHLESMPEDRIERTKQLETALDTMNRIDPETSVIFGGDTNLQDFEVGSRVPDNIYDLWVATGSKPEMRYTYDTTINNNRGFKSIRDRLDRLFIRHSQKSRLKPAHFQFVGTDKLLSCDRFPSDHFGILVHFDKS